MGILGDVAGIFKKDRKLFLACNGFLFGLFALGLLAGLAFPAVHDLAAGHIERATAGGPVAEAERTLESGDVLLGTWQIFTNNLFITVVVAALPSLVFPPWILIVFGAQFFLFGVVFPVASMLAKPWLLVPLLGTLVLEGEGYVIAIFASMRLIVALIWPRRLGERSIPRAYLRAIADNARLLLVAGAVLAAAALFEAASLVLALGLTR